MITNASDGGTPLALQSIGESGIIKGEPSYFLFNNSGFFASNRDQEDEFGPIHWKRGIKSFEFYFKKLSSMKAITLSQTQKVLDERKHINVTIEGLTLKIQRQLTKMEDLRKTREVIENHKTQINANSNFTYTSTKSDGNKSG